MGDREREAKEKVVKRYIQESVNSTLQRHINKKKMYYGFVLCLHIEEYVKNKNKSTQQQTLLK